MFLCSPSTKHSKKSLGKQIGFLGYFTFVYFAPEILNWERNTDCIVDVCMRDLNQPSCLGWHPASILKLVEVEKKKKYIGQFLTQ